MSTSSSFSRTLAAIRATYDAEKRQKELAESFIWAHVYRPVSFYLTVPLIWLRLTANQVTLLGFLVAVVGLLLLAQGGGQTMFIGAVGILMFVLLDHCDGNVARYHQTASGFGELLDGVVDNVVYGSLSFFLGLGLTVKYLGGNGPVSGLVPAHWWFILGAAASCCHFLRIYLPAHLANATGAGLNDFADDENDSTVGEVAQGSGHWSLDQLIYVARNIVHTLPIFLVILAFADFLWPLLVLLSVARFVALLVTVFRGMGTARRMLS